MIAGEDRETLELESLNVEASEFESIFGVNSVNLDFFKEGLFI